LFYSSGGPNPSKVSYGFGKVSQESRQLREGVVVVVVVNREERDRKSPSPPLAKSHYFPRILRATVLANKSIVLKDL
jgi:hypothetical protein